MGRRIKGRFLAQDDLNLDGHHIIGWNFLEDIPRGGAATGQVMVWKGDEWGPTTLTGGDGSYVVTWGDVQDKPSTYSPSAHTHPWSEVTGKPSFVNTVSAGLGITVSGTTGDVTITNAGVRSVTAGLGISVSAATGANIEISNSIQADQTEPTGFIGTPGTFTSTIVVTDNRTFSIGPDSGEDSFSFYVKGVKYTKTTTESITFPDTEGIHAFYYDSTGTLNTTLTPLDGSIFTENALCAVLRWDSSESAVIYFGEERHGMVMDGKTHQYLHDTEGTRMIGGHALSDITADGDGDLDSSATLSVESGTIADEDLFLSAAATTSSTQTWYVFSKTDTGDWQRHGPTNFPLRYTASNTPTYNLFSGATWSQSIIGNQDYVLAHIYRTNSTTTPYIVIQGENGYGSLSAAREGAADEINQLVQSGMPFVEFHPLGTLIYEHRTAYANTPRARIRATDDGDDYVDWRFSALTPGAGPNDHGNLSGLTDQDHPTSALQQTGATTGQVIEWTGTTWLPNDVVNSVTSSTGISLSSTNGDVTITCDLTWSELADKPTFVNSVTAGNNIELSATTGAVTIGTTSTPSFQTVDVTGNLILGGNLDIGGDIGFDTGGAITGATTITADSFNANTRVTTPEVRITDNDMFIGYGGADQDQSIYFHEGGSDTGRRIRWDDSENRFDFNDTVNIQGSLDVENNIFVNSDGPDGNGNIYFYDGGSLTGAWLKWIDGDGRFEISDTLLSYGSFIANGAVEAGGNITAEGNVFADYSSANGRVEMNIDRRGVSIDMQNETGGWARGYYFYNNTTILGGFYGYGVAGDMTKMGISQDYTTSNAGIHWDMTNNYVGINDASPSYPLDVGGNGRFNVGTANLALLLRSTDPVVYLQLTDDTGNAYVQSEAGNIQLRSSGGLVLQCDPDLTATFSSTLNVSDDLNVDGAAIVEGSAIVRDGSSDFPLQLQSTDPSVGMQLVDSAGTGDLYYSGSLDRLYFRDDADNFVIRADNDLFAVSGDVYVNYNGPDGDSSIFFYDGGSATNQRIFWDDSVSRFVVSAKLVVAGDVQANSNIYINRDGADGDGFLYFYEGGSDTGRYLRWRDSSNWFELNDTLVLQDGGGLYASFVASYGNVYLNHVGPDGDSYLYFYDGGSATGQNIRWSDAAARFYVSDQLQVEGLLRVEGQTLCYDNVYVNYNGPEGDSYIFFYDNSSYAGAYLQWDDSTERFTFNKALQTNSFLRVDNYADIAGQLYGRGNVHVNYGGPDGDSYIYFYEGGSSTGSYIRWDDSENEFYFNKNVRILGLLECDSNITGANIVSDDEVRAGGDFHVNNDGPEGDGFIYFYDGGSRFGEYLQWDDSADYFQFSNDLRISGNLYADSNIYINYNGPDGDNGIYFYDGSSAVGQSFYWDDSADEFVLTSDLQVDGAVRSDNTNGTITSITSTSDVDVLSVPVTSGKHYLMEGTLIVFGAFTSPDIGVSFTNPGSTFWWEANIDGTGKEPASTNRETLDVPTDSTYRMHKITGFYYATTSGNVVMRVRKSSSGLDVPLYAVITLHGEA